MKKFYKILEGFPSSFDQTSDHSNNTRGLSPETYRSPQVDEEEYNSETVQVKDGIKKIIDAIRGKQILNEQEINKIRSLLEHILNKM